MTGGEYGHGSRPTVLIVDDQPAVAGALARLLKEDYRVQVAVSGERALRLIDSTAPPDLILLDVEMPELGGYDLCRILRERPDTRHLPVVFVTARGSVEDEEYGLRIGAVDYISKPFYPAVVRARVRTHMNLKIRTDMLEKLAMVDGLTGVPNRRHFDEHLREEWARFRRHGHPLGLIMLDVDHFKAYNDHYGHGAGDGCLTRVARALSDALHRPCDLLARYGGEEFVALLPDTDGPGLLHVAGVLQRALADLALPHAVSPTADVVTASMGLGLASMNMGDARELLHATDEALYQAKEGGRNRAVLAG